MKNNYGQNGDLKSPTEFKSVLGGSLMERNVTRRATQDPSSPDFHFLPPFKTDYAINERNDYVPYIGDK